MAEDTWRKAYLGSARVALSNLRPIQWEVSLNTERVEVLMRRFALQSCKNYDESTRLLVCIESSDWGTRRRSNIGQHSLDIVEPAGDEKFFYAQGRHRLAAASSYLTQDDCYWGVDFYAKDRKFTLFAMRRS